MKETKNKILTIILFEILYKAIFLVIVLPSSAFLFSSALKLSKYSYITLENLLAFSGYWLSIISLLITVLIASAFFYVEMVCLFLFFQHSMQYKNLSVSQIIYPGLKKSWQLIRCKKNLFLPLFCLICGLVFGLPLYIGMIFRQRIPEYIFDNIIKNQYAIAIAVLLIAGAVVFVYYGLFALQYCCYNDMTFSEALKESRKTVKHHHTKCMLSLFIVNAVLCIFYTAVYFLIIILAGFIIYFFVDNSLSTAVFFTVYDIVNRYFGFIFSVVGVVVNCILISRLFLSYSEHRVMNIRDHHQLINNIRISQDATGKHRYFKCRFTRKISLVAIISFLCICIYIGINLNDNFIKRAPLFGTYITAHRGYPSEAPENTLASIQAAIDALSDYVEVDVQETKDGVVVLLHDTNLNRTTGVNKYIWNVTYEELESYNASYLMPEKFDNLRIPTLEEALLLCQNTIFMNIELKVNSHEESLVEKVMDLILRYGMEDQCVITSTSYGALRRVKDISENVKTGYIMSLAYGYFYNNDYADFFSVKSSFITNDMIQLAHSYGKEIHAWTVNQVSEIERMKQLGVDNVITDYPIRVREVIYADEWTVSFTEFLRTLIN